VSVTHLAVLVRLRAAVVESRLLPLVDGLRLGDEPGAAVGFPGGLLRVHRDRAGGWAAGGRALRAGRPIVFRFGDLEVQLEATAQAPSFVARDALPDPRLVVGALSVLLVALAIEVTGRIFDDRPELAAGLQALVLGSASAPVPPAEPPVVGLASEDDAAAR
jgi:hypothetical protein